MAIMKDNTRLKILLKKNHMKQREFADWFCISQHAAWEVTNGNRPLKDFEIVEICERFHVTSDWLLGLSDIEKPVETVYKDEILDMVVKAAEDHRAQEINIPASSGCGWGTVRAGKLR